MVTFSNSVKARPALGALIILVIVCQLSFLDAADEVIWKKHLVMEKGHCNTAVALDVNGDKHLDVIASFNGKVSLFIAPDWKKEVVLHRFFSGGRSCIHSAVIDADGDGDLDLLNAGRGTNNVVWYENPLK